MAWQIIYDPDARIAALVDPDAPAALGPIAIGEGEDDPRLPLQEFVNGLDTPPDEMATWPLFNEWNSYVQAIVEMVQREAEAQAAAEGADGAEAGGSVTPGDAPASDPVPEGEATDPAADDTAPEAPEVTAQEDQEAAARIAAAPHTPAKDGREECWMCHGDLTIDGPQGRVECPVCHGEGTVPAAAE